MTTAALEFARKDLAEVIAVQELMVQDGNRCPKLGQYWDELYDVMSELKTRGLSEAA